MRGFQTMLVGGTSLTGTEVVQHIELPTSTDTSDIIKTVVQLVIGVATLLQLFKKKRPKSNN